MKKEIKTSITIHATTEKIWNILTDFENYPNWNPFVRSLTGLVQVGNTITVRVQPGGSKGMTFKPKVLTVIANKEIKWIGHFLFSGLFDGEHQFELIDNGDGTTLFQQSEKFKGIFVPLFNTSNTQKGFEAMNEKLKALAEAK
jgi:hypothetical protein